MKKYCFSLLSVLVFVAGCISSNHTAVSYVLAPETTARPEQVSPVKIKEVLLPEYLNRLEIVRRKGRNQVVVSQYGRWATNLRAQMQSLLGQMLFAQTATSIRIHFKSFTADEKGFSAEGTAFWEDGRIQPFAIFLSGKCDTDDLLVRKADEALVQLAQQLNTSK